MFNFKEYNFKSFSLALMGIVYTLGFVGVYLISILQDEGESLYQRQIKGLLAGIFIIFVVASVDYHFIAKFFIPLYIVSMTLLLICRYSYSYPIYGWNHYQARRWIKIGGDPSLGEKNKAFEFMPSEITKIVMIVFIAKLFDICRKSINEIWVLLTAIVLMAIPTFFILIQTDLSTSVVMVLVFCVLVFAAGVPYKFLLPILGAGIPVGIGLFWYVQQDYQILLTYYQQRRILAALHPENYPELMYQQSNAAAAIKSGGMLGKMLTGDTGIRGTTFVPVKESDFIFTAVCEEFGFLGAVITLALYFTMIVLIFRIANRAKDYLGFLIALGIGAMLCFQVFINIGVVTSLLPNTGLCLPFMSQGLSSLLIDLVMVGMLLNISMQPKGNTSSGTLEYEFLD